jgi:chromosome segregation ATPase
MKSLTLRLSAVLLALAATGVAQAAKEDLDVARLTNSLDQLSGDPSLGSYAQAEQARARDAVNQLAQARSRDRAHALYLAERRVDLARATAQLQDAQQQINRLDREHDQIQLDGSRREAEMARRELERQRLQYQMEQEESARQLAAGAEATAQAQAQADQAKKVAAAQARVANAAKKQAELAAQAAKLMRSQMQQGDNGSSENKDQGK